MTCVVACCLSSAHLSLLRKPVGSSPAGRLLTAETERFCSFSNRLVFFSEFRACKYYHHKITTANILGQIVLAHNLNFFFYLCKWCKQVLACLCGMSDAQW